MQKVFFSLLAVFIIANANISQAQSCMVRMTCPPGCSPQPAQKFSQCSNKACAKIPSTSARCQASIPGKVCPTFPTYIYDDNACGTKPTPQPAVATCTQLAVSQVPSTVCPANVPCNAQSRNWRINYSCASNPPGACKTNGGAATGAAMKCDTKGNFCATPVAPPITTNFCACDTARFPHCRRM